MQVAWKFNLASIGIREVTGSVQEVSYSILRFRPSRVIYSRRLFSLGIPLTLLSSVACAQ